jgi:hypothetical protein
MDDESRHGQDEFSGAAIGDAFDSLNDDVSARVKAELEPGERMLWVGRSLPAYQAAGYVFYAFCAIALVVLCLGLIGMSRGLDRQRVHDGTEMVAGMVFTAFAFAVVLGLIGNWRWRAGERVRAAEVLYAITDRRAIIWTPEPKGNAVRIRTIPRGEISTLVRLQRPDGSGSLFFSSTQSDALREMDADYYQFGFRDVADVRRVEQIVRNYLMGSERES